MVSRYGQRWIEWSLRRERDAQLAAKVSGLNFSGIGPGGNW
jgi:hypothetical protein